MNIEYHKRQAYIYSITYHCSDGYHSIKFWLKWKRNALWVLLKSIRADRQDKLFLATYAMLCALMCASSFVQDAHADDEGLWITTGEWSRHNDQGEHGYRQNNSGLGLQYDLSKETSIVAGWYNNSIHRESVYMGITWTPLEIGDSRFGAMYGMATGYDRYVAATPIASLYGTYEMKTIGFNILWLPGVVVAAQIKVRLK